MKTLIVIFSAALLAGSLSKADAKSTFVLRSNAFTNGATIPHEYAYDGYGCTGKNVSPELEWSGVPAGVKSFALTVFDPDANKGKGWWHWVVYGIDPKTRDRKSVV